MIHRCHYRAAQGVSRPVPIGCICKADLGGDRTVTAISKNIEALLIVGLTGVFTQAGKPHRYIWFPLRPQWHWFHW